MEVTGKQTRAELGLQAEIRVGARHKVGLLQHEKKKKKKLERQQ